MEGPRQESSQVVAPCPIAPVVDVVHSKWTAQVLWCLLHHGRLRFGELRQRLPAVTAKVLAQRLRQLERDGLVTRTLYEEMPPRVEYEATDLAASLSPVFAALAEWSRRHLAEVETARVAYEGPLVS
ncbi:helix-turn-helix domain-containing protein [Streptomyces coacervatus]|uniref:Helix-turn-helix domain-containing protein n=1 Tax=Streptomyces coacervatus TaxID=647381 RepID=A0ABP7IX37_9ACTN|nr:helix-turn-helix domain-containing protein [Streptomyces coacervatus]MDF2269635.1 helix-turn-helix domain-containing protein [Streptomyces coacervatus]